MSDPMVIGIGNTDRGDDGIGPLAARRLAGRSGARIIVRSGDALALIEDWAGADMVILIDAAAATSRPGSIHRLEFSPRDMDFQGLGMLAPTSTHALGLAEAIALARALDRLPEHVVVYAVEGRCFAAGAPISAEVLAAADELVDLIVAELARLRAPPPCRKEHA